MSKELFTDKEMLCDLHAHTYYSDGTFSPSELVREAERVGLSAIALTDHNTIDGVSEFLSLQADTSVRLIGGIEFSTEWRGKELHILALGLSEEHFPAITSLVDEMLARKKKSNDELIDRLIAAGYKISRERIFSLARGVINRARVAAELIRCGYVKDREEAFSHLLAKGGGYYFEPKYLDTLDVISFIREIGAFPVLAHPLLNISVELLRELLPLAVAAGLGAMEVIYSEYNEQQTALSLDLVREFGILPSGGSDFHGKNKCDISLGTGKGELRVPLGFAQDMKLI